MYRFTVCELKTGKVLDDAPLTINGELSRVLQAYSEGTLQLPLLHEATPETWEQLILPMRSLILVLDEMDRIVWHGIPVNRVRTGEPIVSYPCATIEYYLLRRYVPTMIYTRTDQATIARALAGLAADAAGIPLLFDTPATRVQRDREYADDENARVYTRLQELAAVQDGFNWTIDVDWTDDTHSQVSYTFRTGYPYLGRRVNDPDHVYELPGNLTGFSYEERWGEGDAGTHVRAIGDGEGSTKVMSSPVIDTLREGSGWPRLEERTSFSGVTSVQTIASHAHQMAVQLFGGQNVITLDARSDDGGTPLGQLTLGDSALVSIDAPSLTLDEVWVVVGWSLGVDSRTYKPTLARMEA